MNNKGVGRWFFGVMYALSFFDPGWRAFSSGFFCCLSSATCILDEGEEKA